MRIKPRIGGLGRGRGIHRRGPDLEASGPKVWIEFWIPGNVHVLLGITSFREVPVPKSLLKEGRDNGKEPPWLCILEVSPWVVEVFIRAIPSLQMAN